MQCRKLFDAWNPDSPAKRNAGENPETMGISGSMSGKEIP